MYKISVLVFITKVEMQRKDNLVKIKTCMVTQYFEYYDVQEIAVIETRIRGLTYIKSYAIVIHDRDLLESGELKKKHYCSYHFLVEHLVVIQQCSSSVIRQKGSIGTSPLLTYSV